MFLNKFVEIGSILIPPSSNWFCSNAVDFRNPDKIFVSASFKFLVVYQLQDDALPRILKLIPFNEGKIINVKLFNDFQNNEFKNFVATYGDHQTVCIYDISLGCKIASHTVHGSSVVNGIAWATVENEDIVVSVGEGGLVVSWLPLQNISKKHIFENKQTITHIEVDPCEKGRAIMACSKILYLICLKSFNIIAQFRGHDSDIYCIKWLAKEFVPYGLQDIPYNSRANALKSGSADISSKDKCDDNGSLYVASSDFTQNIFLWSIKAKKYISRCSIAPMKSGKGNSKEKFSGKSYISLAWHRNVLISSTISGKILHYICVNNKLESKTIHDLHYKNVYNILIMENIILTFGHDRIIHGYDFVKKKHIFQLPTIGASANVLSFCPHDTNRVAIGQQENSIRLLNLGSIPAIKSNLFFGIKGKVFSLSWHPSNENLLLFGTSEGQVGFVNVNNCHISSFAYFHQKTVYKVEWAPPVYDKYSNFSDEWYAYSCGDYEIVMRSIGNLIEDPIKLKNLFSSGSALKLFKNNLTEFSFSSDYKYLCCGFHDGKVLIYDRSTLSLLVIIEAVRQAIQHLLWKPSQYEYTLVVGSNENKIFLFYLTETFQGQNDKAIVLTQASKELLGHMARVVWLSWSPHLDTILASASYDHTVQLWDTEIGTQIGNFCDHSLRVFRVEFSPSDPDLLFSFSDESCIRVWRPSELICKTVSEGLAFMKSSKVNSKAVNEVPIKKVEISSKPQKGEVSQAAAPLSVDSLPRKFAFRSFFPHLHDVTARKKSFHYLSLLSLLQIKMAKAKSSADSELPSYLAEDDLDDLSNTSIKLSAVNSTCRASIINEILNKYSFLSEKDVELPSVEDMIYVLDFYGDDVEFIENVTAKEILVHESNENQTQTLLMHCWKGSLDAHIKEAIGNKCLTPMMIAFAPQVSLSLWELACTAYAEQLVEDEEIIFAASYLISINKVEDSVKLLIKYKYYREALAITKLRLPFNEKLLLEVIESWITAALLHGNLELAAILNVSIEHYEKAARILSRRNNYSSMLVSANLFAASDNNEMAEATAVLSLREALFKCDYDKIIPIIQLFPTLKWFLVLYYCYKRLIQFYEDIKDGRFSGFLSSHDSSIENDKHQSILDAILEDWKNANFLQDDFPHLYQNLLSHFAAQSLPTSIKQMWFLESVHLSKMLLCNSENSKKDHFEDVIKSALSFEKFDQIYIFLRTLAPFGIANDYPHIPDCKYLSHILCICEVHMWLAFLEDRKTDSLLYISYPEDVDALNPVMLTNPACNTDPMAHNVPSMVEEGLVTSENNKTEKVAKDIQSDSEILEEMHCTKSSTLSDAGKNQTLAKDNDFNVFDRVLQESQDNGSNKNNEENSYILNYTNEINSLENVQNSNSENNHTVCETGQLAVDINKKTADLEKDVTFNKNDEGNVIAPVSSSSNNENDDVKGENSSNMKHSESANASLFITILKKIEKYVELLCCKEHKVFSETFAEANNNLKKIINILYKENLLSNCDSKKYVDLLSK